MPIREIPIFADFEGRTMIATHPESRIGLAKEEIRRFDEDVARWCRPAPATSRDPGVWRDLIARANFLFGRLLDLDSDLQEAVLLGHVTHDAETEVRIDALLREWHGVAQGLAPRAEGDSGLPGSVEGADLLAANLAEARGILTPDAEFFAGPALDGLEQDAVAEHRAGQTEAMTLDEHGTA